MLVRDAAPDDLSRICAIYNDEVRTGTATFDTQEVTVESRSSWLAKHRDRGLKPENIFLGESGEALVAEGESLDHGESSGAGVPPARKSRIDTGQARRLPHFSARKYPT